MDGEPSAGDASLPEAVSVDPGVAEITAGELASASIPCPFVLVPFTPGGGTAIGGRAAPWKPTWSRSAGR